MNLSDENIELYLFRFKEGLLDAAETAEVERALRERPDWQEMADLYDPKLTLPAGVTMTYDDYGSLRDGGPKAANIDRKPIVLREDNPQRRRLMPLWTTVAAAACLLLFVTTIIKFTGEGSPSGSQLVAKMVPDTTSQTPNDDATNIQTPDLPTETVVRQVVRHNEPTLLAEANLQTETATADKEQAVATPTPVTPSDSSVYDFDEPTLREVNDPMDQEILYASGVIERRKPSEGDESVTRREQLRSLARRATAVVATAATGHKQRRDAFEDAIEEHLENNELISNLIATLE